MGRHPPSWADAAPQLPFPPAHLEPGPSAGLPCPAPPDPGHPRPAAGPPSAQRCCPLFCPRGGGHAASHAHSSPPVWRSKLPGCSVPDGGGGAAGAEPQPQQSSSTLAPGHPQVPRTPVRTRGHGRWGCARRGPPGGHLQSKLPERMASGWQTQMVKEGGAGAGGGAVSGAEAPRKQPGVTRTTGVSRDVTWIPSPVNPGSPYCQTTFKIKPHFGKSERRKNQA